MEPPARFSLILMLATTLTAGSLGAQDAGWEPLTGEDVLREFMSGLEAERDLPGGGVTRARYNADGTGVLESWGETFPRTWSVEGESQVCITPESVPDNRIICIEIERSTSDPTLYRVRQQVGEVLEFRAEAKRAVAADAPKDSPNEGAAASASASEIAAKLADPNAVIGTLNTNFDFVSFDGTRPGADSQTGFTLGFQPSLPYPVGEGKNFFLRPLIPIVLDQPLPGPDGFDSAGPELGNIGFDAAMGFSLKGGYVVLVGAAGSLPTSTDDAVGSDQWLLGPEFLVAKVNKWGVLALLTSHLWDVAGDDSFNTSITSGQYIYAFFLKNGWSITAQPPFSYNHEAPSDDAFTFALGVGVGKTAILGGRPWKMSAQYWHFVEGPKTFGASDQIRITIGPVVNLPWGG